MGRVGNLGKAAATLAAGGLGVLGATKLLDDRHVDTIWRALEDVPGDERLFNEGMVADLPDPARRYFLHAIEPGTRLATRVHFGYSGELKPGEGMPWLALAAEQIVAKERGFVWKATAQKGPLIATAADYYLDGAGRMRVALFGLLPMISASGPDISRSALGRLLIEGVLLPPALLPGPNLRIEGVDGSRFRVVATLHGYTTPVTITVDPDGRPTEVTMDRWGNQTEDRGFQPIPYGGRIQGERTFSGYTVPGKIDIGWWYGTDRYQEAVRFNLEWAAYR